MSDCPTVMIRSSWPSRSITSPSRASGTIGCCGNLTREDRVPEPHQLRTELPPCFGNDGRRGDGPGVGERVEDRVQAKEVIAMAVGDVDRREVLSGRPDPVHDPPRVLGGEQGVDQDRVMLAADQRDRRLPARSPRPHPSGVSARRSAGTGRRGRRDAVDRTWQLPSERSGVVTVFLSPAYSAVKMLTCIA